MQSAREVQRPVVWARLDHPVSRSIDRLEYQRAVVRWSDGDLRVGTTGAQASSRLLSLVGANALIKIAPGESDYPAGEPVETLVTGPIGG